MQILLLFQVLIVSGVIRDMLPDTVQRVQASQGRITGPTRRSTKGQWTPEEDEILRMAVQRFQGKNWKKIAELIKDRTDVQCLHRWQKVLNPDLVKGPWSKEEDEIIVELVNKYGPKKWSTIAQHLPGRIGKQCRERWHNHLNPGINKEAWTQDEELALIRAHQIYGNKWAELTKFLPGRSDNAIKNHWNSSLKKKLDMYLASGLLSQFQGSSIASLSNNSVASSSSKPHKSSEDDMARTETEEASECSQSSYIPSFSQETPFVTPEEPCGAYANSLDHDFSLDWSKLGMDELPDMSLLDIGQESSGHFMHSSNGGANCEPIPSAYIELGGYTSIVNTVVCADGPNLIADNDGCPSFDVIRDFDGQEDPLLNYGLYHQMPLLAQDQYNCLPHVNADCESILSTTPDASTVKRVPANNFALVPSPKDKIPEESGEREGSRALFYEPPHFPSSDIPFLSCDLVQLDGDKHQEFSPFGIRQLTNSLRLWDSPSRNEDSSPMAILKFAAKSFTGTPSILKKRQRDLLSPLSEERGEKKLLGRSEELISELRNDICRLEVMFNECEDGKGAVLPLSPDGGGNLNCTKKDNVHPACEISERNISLEECCVGEVSEKMIERAEIETETVTMGQNAMDTDKDSSGILIEHDTNDLLFFSPDCFGIKCNASFGASARSVLSPSEVSYFSVICSPHLRTKKDGSNNFFTATSLQSASPSENKLKSSGKARNLETNGICMETPLKRNIETPSPWKSPWFVNAFVPGPRVDTDITIEDFGYYLSPEDSSYDAIGLMKRVGEQTAGALANAQKILGDDTPETLLKGKHAINNKEDEKENIHSPNSHKKLLRSTSSIMTERRTLDFSECETPVKESASTSDYISISSPSSYLLKACR